MPSSPPTQPLCFRKLPALRSSKSDNPRWRYSTQPHSFTAASAPALLHCIVFRTDKYILSFSFYSSLFFVLSSSVSTSTADSPCLETRISPTVLQCILTHFTYTPTDPRRDLGITLPFNRTSLQSLEQVPPSNLSLQAQRRMIPFRDTQQAQ
jgi:hypothetical protein